jgi:hypothetical protein
VLTVGAAYAASAGDKERRKKTPGQPVRGPSDDRD